MPLVATGSTRLALHRVGDGVLLGMELARPDWRRDLHRPDVPGGGDPENLGWSRAPWREGVIPLRVNRICLSSPWEFGG